MAKHMYSDKKCLQKTTLFSNTAEVCSAALSTTGAQNLQRKLKLVLPLGYFYILLCEIKLH